MKKSSSQNPLKNKIVDFLQGFSTISVTCNQWGDTGKGKFVDLFAEWADIIARGTGGDNCGHSIEADGKKFVFHIIPSGILRDGQGKINIIGNGTVVNPRTVINELALLAEQGCTYSNLMLAYNAKLILPTQIVMDRIKERSAGVGKIGTTGRGIGPTYTDHYSRKGLVINDLLNPEIFRQKFKAHLDEKKMILKNYDYKALKTIMHHKDLESGFYWDDEEIFAEENVVERYLQYGEILRPLIKDTDAFIRNAKERGLKILLEGAQGTLLSIDHGTTPFVTSSDCSVGGLARGAGLKESDVGLSFGIVKGLYMTRVGEGPFPTEFGGDLSAEWCGNGLNNEETERENHSASDINCSESFSQGIALRILGREYGATTGRPRRTGWLDLPLLRHALQFGGEEMIFTKLDVLDTCETIQVCTEYEYQGPDYRFGDHLYQAGDHLGIAIPDSNFLKYCAPVYQDFKGWKTSIRGIRSYQSLPDELLEILDFVISQVPGNLNIISVGPGREETIFL